MKKICIVTICNGSNFGNRLQNYALQETLESRFECRVMTARNLSGEIGRQLLRFAPLHAFLRSGFAQAAASTLLKNGRLLKKFKFLRFNGKYIHLTPQYLEADRVPTGFADRFDYFVAGSDQIWNPEIGFNSSVEYLHFAPSVKKIAYAASFGVAALTEQQLEYTERMLEDFAHISVREAAALSILEQVGHFDVPVVLDPTMLLTAQQWRKLEEKPAFSLEEGKYLLSYILGRENTLAKKQAEALCMQNGWVLVDINDPDQYLHYGIGPGEFLYLIDHAADICTDSFHASVFSTLFHKNFTVFTRGNMNSRISTLLDTVSGGREIRWDDGACVPELEYTLADRILEQERIRSLAFLEQCIEAAGGNHAESC